MTSFDFDELQARLSVAMTANTAESLERHVVLALPSFSVGDSLLSHYGERLIALEHRYLVSLLMTQRIYGAVVIIVTSRAPAPEVLDYYRSLGPQPESFDSRSLLISLDDPSPRSVAAKLLDRPDALDRIEALVDGLPSVIEPWNVTEDEVHVAERLRIPINGTAPSLRRHGFKSAGRRLLREAGVCVPDSREGLRTLDDVLAAIAMLQGRHPRLERVVVKHDDSGAGDGNASIEVRDRAGAPTPVGRLRQRLESLPAWYLDDLANGAVVEEFLTGQQVCSPSAQVDLLPDGRAVVVATHEQVLGGENGQVFLGCRFPAAPVYAARLAADALAIGQRYAALGVVGRISVDFMTVRDLAGAWHLYALEVNLRKGGTPHPYTALRNLVPGPYDVASGRWMAANGGPRSYVSSDNCVDSSGTRLSPGQVIQGMQEAGLAFDHSRGTGVVLHMLDGRFGAVAIGTDPEHAQSMFDGTLAAVADLA